MDLVGILTEFNLAKDQLRQNTLFKTPRGNRIDGLSMAVNYAQIMEYAVVSLFNLTQEELHHRDPLQGIGAFLYGSPGRREMVCESDLDLLLVYRDNSTQYQAFKESLKRMGSSFKFCKIDLPEWGTLDDAKIFASRSITEGNQVLEARFVCGDPEISSKVSLIQDEEADVDRMTRNIVFQKFYFDQYFKQRVRNGSINVKYCDGGSRDYLFIHWFNNLMKRAYPGWEQAKGERPVAELGLANLYRNGLLSSLEFGRSIDALNFNLILRNEILLANKGTKDEGLTFLDDQTCQSVFARIPGHMKEYNIKSPTELLERFDEQRSHIGLIKNRIWALMIEERAKGEGGPKWLDNFNRAYASGTSEIDRMNLLAQNDVLTRIASIWGASNSGQTKTVEEISQLERDSPSWEIQASLATSPLCSSEYLHHIAKGIGKEKGYGYILRIVSRNPNVTVETLESIATDSRIEDRYKQCAKAALDHGKEAANHQV